MLSRLSLEAPVYDTWKSDNKESDLNTDNPDLHEVGIGISGDQYNYYIVTIWK